MRYRCNHLCLQKSFKLHRQPAQCCSCSTASDLSLSITPQFFFSLVIFYIIIAGKSCKPVVMSLFAQQIKLGTTSTGCWRNKVWNQMDGQRLHPSLQKHGAFQLFTGTCAHTQVGHKVNQRSAYFFRHYRTQNEMKQMSIWPGSQKWWLFTSSKQQLCLAHHLLPNTCLSLLVMFCLMQNTKHNDWQIRETEK